MRWRVARIALTCAAMSACDTPTVTPSAFAYDPTSLTSGQLYRWADNQRIRVWVVPPVQGTTPDLAQAVARARSAWNAVPRGNGFTLVAAATPAEAHVIVYDRASPLPVDPSASCAFAPRNAGGYTYLCPVGGRAARLPLAGSGTGVATVVVRIDVGRFGSQAALDAIVTHELGHAVGIGGHSSESADVMFALPTVSAPTGRDTQTLRWLLGQAPDFLL